ncbi:MAG: rRNA maturation RNase YbeY [Bacillota bacterium]|nr:rRNA maturation RNase YbeY [Bacillota bacterium]
MELVVIDDQHNEVFTDEMEKIANGLGNLCLVKHQLPENCELTLVLVDDEQIQQLNKEHRAIDKPTDVLSFPQYDSLAELEESFLQLQGDEQLLLGDIVISLETATKQAKDYNHSNDRELGYLFIHGLLHLLGYDHMNENEQQKMRQAEEELLGQLDLLRE